VDNNPLDGSRQCWVSAQTGEGMEAFLREIASHFQGDYSELRLLLQPEQGRERASLYQLGEILEESFTESGEALIRMRLSQAAKQRLSARDDIQILG
jgi:GTP-binding protein HflX